MANTARELEKPAGLYANFPGRLNAISADLVILVLFSIAIFALASVGQSLRGVRIGLVIFWWLTIIL